MAKKKGKKKKNKGPKKDPKITVAEYLLDCGTQKKLRLMDNAGYWQGDNRELQTQVGSLRSELEATIGYLRRQEGNERRAGEEDLAAREGELREVEAQLSAEQRQHERALFELSKELREVMVEAADTEEQVNFWKNYPFNQSLEKREKIRCLKSGIKQVDELHDALEVQLDGNFRYMQGHLTSGHAGRLERAKRSAAGRALRRVSLSDHSDLTAQPGLCLQSVISRQRGEELRDRLDWVDGENASLQRSLAPLRRLHPPPSASPTPISRPDPPTPTATATGVTPIRLHVESLTHLLTSSEPTPAERELSDRVRDTTLAQLRPDEDEQRARALARLARPAASELGASAGSLVPELEGEEGGWLSEDQLLPFEIPAQVPASVRRQSLQPFEAWSPQRHWWRVSPPRPRARRWPVTGPHLALYAEKPPVFDLSGPKVINESPSVSSAHISDEWEQSKVGWQEHLRRRSVVSVESSPSGGSETGVGGDSAGGTEKGGSGSSTGAPGGGGASAGAEDARAGSGGKLAEGSSSRGEDARSVSERKEVKTKTSKKVIGTRSSKTITKSTSSKAKTGVV